jgi:hypothetical protein
MLKYTTDLLKTLTIALFDRNTGDTGQNDLNPFTQHQGGKFWTKPNS